MNASSFFCEFGLTSNAQEQASVTQAREQEVYILHQWLIADDVN
jgi:hypothetical protein